MLNANVSTRIIRENYQRSSFAFLRPQRANEADYRQTIKGGVVYGFGWGTGFEELIFENDEDASK